MNQTAAYSPSYLFGLFPTTAEPLPGDPIPAGPDYSTNNVESYAYGTVARLSHGFGRRTMVSEWVRLFALSISSTTLPFSAISTPVSWMANGRIRAPGTLPFTSGTTTLTGSLGYGADVSTDENGLGVGMSYPGRFRQPGRRL